ncbi:hypothetical protein CONCODRAFT_2555 [Conidiobolus coronatus NRRL 28638]|uniref:Uncharacterized protein n=1 Tax=Conidiobolus coronatus (strain ATCC 28846 / CBS 209.66 / NRRL 28638) TaxID=796925 RepID=A0A137PHE4_CONC2|nr:hypothetical protein CONCODRAFT_2555 [Conidiobolus coronatus NRRL 28638]|eukprot:KXN74351.1 hypothetical protein CONCODRAFT_2555 [Conidiobolus coronatus NRRL 28638]
MYSEEILYEKPYSDRSLLNKLKTSYFENRNCLTNVLDFLDQEVVIMPGKYFSYDKGIYDIVVNNLIYTDIEDDQDKYDLVCDSMLRIDLENGYHLSILDNYINIVANDRICIFTNKDMEEGDIIGTIVWVNNYNELLKNFSDRNLKMISKAIICPLVKKNNYNNEEIEYLDEEFLFFMDIYYPDVAFKYTFDTYMSNVCIDVYNKLVKSGLNGLVDKYITSYKQCDGYGEKKVKYYTFGNLCKCGGLKAFCYLDL